MMQNPEEREQLRRATENAADRRGAASSDVPRRRGDRGSTATPEQGRAFEAAMGRYYDFARAGAGTRFVPENISRGMTEAARALPIGTEVRYEGGVLQSDNPRGTYVKTINGRWEQYRDGKRVVPQWATASTYNGLTDDGFASRISSPTNARVTVATRRGR